MIAQETEKLDDTAWTAAEFDDDGRKAKFLKLMGGAKVAANKPVLSLGGQKAHRPTLSERLGAARATSTLTLRADPALEHSGKKGEFLV